MSLDVSLTLDTPQKVERGSGIFVRDAGQTREISREEWDRLHPGREPVRVAYDDEESTEVYTANITHNLNFMAAEAGIYEALWHPEKIGVAKAAQLISYLRDGLAVLQADPARFEALSPVNGWGDYEGLMRFVASYLGACERWPEAKVSARR